MGRPMNACLFVCVYVPCVVLESKCKYLFFCNKLLTTYLNYNLGAGKYVPVH